MTDVRVVTTGGTIDKIYFDRLSEFAVGDPQVERLLRQANVTFRWMVTPLMRKDSLELTDADREEIVAAVTACDEGQVLVTHGTDTMIETARALVDAELDKVVVLTGSMQPARQQDSDAVFNIGFAIGVMRASPPGVYIAMNGHCFTPDRVRKNRDANRFEPLRH